MQKFIKDPNAKFKVSFHPFSERHFCKTFKKKYKSHWLVTRDAIADSLNRLYGLQERTELEPIQCKSPYFICKFEFKVAKSNVSPHASGNRCIIFVNTETIEVEILLVYSKNEIGPPNETQKWKGIIKEHFPEYWNIFF